jgi:hypothetical protein
MSSIMPSEPEASAPSKAKRINNNEKVFILGGKTNEGENIGRRRQQKKQFFSSGSFV